MNWGWKKIEQKSKIEVIKKYLTSWTDKVCKLTKVKSDLQIINKMIIVAVSPETMDTC